MNLPSLALTRMGLLKLHRQQTQSLLAKSQKAIQATPTPSTRTIRAKMRSVSYVSNWTAHACDYYEVTVDLDINK